MSDGWNNITNMLALKNQRRGQTFDRFSDSLQNLSNTLFTKKENEKDRTHKSSESALEREYGDTPFEDGPRTYTDTVTDTTFEYNTPNELTAMLESLRGQQRKEEVETTQTFQEQLQNDAQEFQKVLQGKQDAAALERLEAELKARAAELERAWIQRREEYEKRTATIADRAYSWTSDQEYELVEVQMQSDLLADRITLEKNGLDSNIMESFDRAYGDMLANHPEWWKEGVGWQVKLTPEMVDQLRSELSSTLEGYARDGALEVGDIPALIELFENRIRHALADDSPDADGPSGPDWVYGQPEPRVPSYLGQSAIDALSGSTEEEKNEFNNISAAGSLGLRPGEYPGEETVSAFPEGVEPIEERLFTMLQQMYKTAEQSGNQEEMDRIDKMAQRVIAPGVDLITDLLREVQ